MRAVPDLRTDTWHPTHEAAPPRNSPTTRWCNACDHLIRGEHLGVTPTGEAPCPKAKP